MDRVEDQFIAIPAPGMAGDHFATAADHNLMDIAPDPDILMAVGYRNRVIVGLVAHQRLRRDPTVVLIAGIKWRRREGAHRSKVTLQSLTDHLAFAAQDCALTLAALFF